MITKFLNFMNESLQNFDLSKLVTIVAINKDGEGNWIYTTINGKKFFLPKEQAGKITFINDKLADFVNSGNPINKYFETDGGDVITYAANIAADAVALNQGRVYLIERKDGRGWAIPGGFVDPGETGEQAAIRELQEETLTKPDNIEKIEFLGMVKCNDPREINFYTFAYLLHIKDPDQLKFADDAKNGKWQLIGRASRSKLAFSHHNEILKKVNF